MDFQALHRHLAECKQEHLLEFWDLLDSCQQKIFFDELSLLNLPELTRFFDATMQSDTTKKLDTRMEPIPEENFGSSKQSSKEDLHQYRELGLTAIQQNEVASLLLAGGQGTRLGVNYPKGMYDVGLPSHKTLFQIQAERIQRLQTVAVSSSSSHGEITTNTSAIVPWYIMTSEGTKEPTVKYFQDNNYFGLQEKNVRVFEQGMLPAFTFEGKIILEDKNKISKAPDGNGGLYKALSDQGILEDMKARGVKYVHVYCVDNILVKMADPVFLGYCINKKADCGAKVVEKINPTEQVGVFCKVDGKYQVVEYSEITSKTAELQNQNTGKLLFNAGNICNHFFTLSFLEKLTSGLESTLVHHIAKKKIPFIDHNGTLVTPTTVNGLKLEKFVFDVFRFSNKFAVWEVPREEDFSPLKNSDTETKDTPTTCRNDQFYINLQRLVKAGARLLESSKTSPQDSNNYQASVQVVEISPLVTEEGEDLEYIVNNFGKELTPPLLILKKGEKIPSSVKEDNVRVLQV